MVNTMVMIPYIAGGFPKPGLGKPSQVAALPGAHGSWGLSWGLSWLMMINHD